MRYKFKVSNSIKIKRVLNNIKSFFIKYRVQFILILPFILIDIFTRLFGFSINYTNYRFYSPILFDICWILLFVGLPLFIKHWYGKFIYITSCSIFIILFFVNNVYFSMTKTFFDFNLLQSASEGSPYILDALSNCNPYVYVALIIIIISFVYAIKNYPYVKHTNYKYLGLVIIAFFALHILTPMTLGSQNKELTWSSWKNARNIYETFNDNNKSMKICGFYEYMIRDFYVTYLKTNDEITEEQIEFLDTSYSESTSKKNSYTGKYSGKNLIIVQLEGMDNWIINKNDTPTLYSMMNSSINFNKHYSYYNGGGSTFNSEFAINTGFITPLSYTKNAYTFNKNSFPNSLANIFKNSGYTVNAFHMNTGEYYSRTTNYLNWGYDNYYGLIDIDNYTDNSYQLDRELMLNEKFDELMFPEDTNFVDYLITYSGHLPFTNTKGVCKMLYEENEAKLKQEYEEQGLEYESEFYQMTEEECVRLQAKETDYMMSLLLDKLKEKGLYDNTVIVCITDHYLYTLEDQTILERYKNTSNNLINNTPFFIWSSDTKKVTINEVTSQLNVLPTLLNLFGYTYNTNNYIGKDALAKNYSGIVFFSDYSWYDGNVYVDNGEVTNDKKISDDKLLEKNEYINYIIKKNDLTLKYNYFKNKKQNS